MTVTEQLHAAIQATNTSDDEVQGALLKGWVVVAEWVDPNGEPWLTRATNEGSVSWQIKGYLHETLYDWTPEDDSE